MSSSITILSKLQPTLGAVGATFVILGIDWSGVLVGLLFFLSRVVAGAAWLLVKPPASSDHTISSGNCNAWVVGILLALFSAILAPALLANGAVEMLPELRTPAMAPAMLIGSVAISIVLALVGLCCCICRHRL